MPVGVPTGARALPDGDARVAAIRSWRQVALLPDFASVSWHEDGADDVAAALLGIGVGGEAGLWHTEAAQAWLGSPCRDRCLRVLLELPDGLDAPAVDAEAGRLLDLVAGAVSPAADPPVLLHGEGPVPGRRCASHAGWGCGPGSALRTSVPDFQPAT